MSPPRVVFDGVWKRFRRGERHDSLRDLIPKIVHGISSGELALLTRQLATLLGASVPLEEALGEAEEYSGLDADVELPPAAHGGQILLACAPDDVERLGSKGLQRIGVVR